MKKILSAIVLLIALCSVAHAGDIRNPASGSSFVGILPVAKGGTGQTTSYFGLIPPVRSPVAFPTVTYSGSAMGSAQYIAPLLGTAGSIYTCGSGLNSAQYSFFGVGLYQRAATAPGCNVLESKTLTPIQINYTTQFGYSGSAMDIVAYGAATTMSVYIDNQFYDFFAPPINTAGASGGTAQAGGTNTITLASGESSTTGYFNTYYVNIISGTGAGQVAQITAYNGSTKVATVASNWTTQPTSSSVYVITNSSRGNYVNGSDGSLNYIHLAWPIVGTHLIGIIGQDFAGVNIGPNDSIWPAPPNGSPRLVAVGDSFIAQTGGPFNVAPETQQLQSLTGFQLWTDGEGGSGWVNPNSTGAYLNFMDRIAPPAESWAGSFVRASVGTYTISVTYNGSTQTTSNIAYNAVASTVQTDIQALSNVPANSVSVGGACDSGGGPSYVGYSPCFIILHNASGATLSWNLTGLTGVTSSYLNLYTGTVAPMVPKDSAGNALPFILYVQGSGNDYGGSYTSTQVGTNSTYAAQQIAARFPTAVTIFSGVVAVSTQGTGGQITSGDLAFNSAIQTSAGYLKPVNLGTAFINTMSAGLNGYQWIDGASSVAGPTTGKNDVLISATVSGHPTGQGHWYLGSRIAQQIKSILGGN